MTQRESRESQREQGCQPLGQRRGPRLTDRDLIVLSWIGEQSAIRFDHLQRLLGHYSTYADRLALPAMLSEHSTRRILRRWLVEELVSYKIFRVGEKGWIWLAELGYAYLGLKGMYRQPLPGEFEQLFRTNEARLQEACQQEVCVYGQQ